MALATVSDVANYVQQTIDGSSSPSSPTVAVWLTEAQAHVEHVTKTKFESNSVSNEVLEWSTDSTTTSAVSFDNTLFTKIPAYVDKLIFKNKNVLTVTSVERNKNGDTVSPDWETLTADTDYIVRHDGIQFINKSKLPHAQQRAVRVSYTYGDTDSATLAKKVVVRMAALDYVSSAVTSDVSGAGGSIRVGDIEIDEGSMRTNSFVKDTQAEVEKLMMTLGTHNTWVI